MAAENTVTSASNFLDSIGINTHSGFGTGSYANSALVLDSLKYIGVDLVRDAYVSVGEAAPVVDALAEAGVQFDFVVSSNLPSGGSAALSSYVTSLQAFQEAHPGSIYAIEGLNEVNLQAFSYEGSASMTAAASFQEALYGAVKANAGLSDIPVINLSVGNDGVADYAAVGNLAAYADYANVHAYTNTSNSADATMEGSISLAKSAAAGDPVIVTETGYTTLQSFNYLGVSETAQAKLVLDNLLNAYENGASKTFLYELFDNSSTSVSDSEQHFGIFNADGTPKLAATALHNMTTILAYQGASSAGNTSTDVQLGNMPTDAHSMTMTKADGVYDIVLWTDATVWNNTTDTNIVNAPTSISVSLGSVQSDVYVYDPLKGTTPLAVYHNVSTINVPLSDSPLIIEVGSKTAVVDSTTTVVAANLTMTAADLVVDLGTLEHATGLQTITLTGGTDLHVSSVSTMQYMISEYKDALAKVQGSFTFSVEYGQATWKEAQTYDSTGKLLSTTDSSISNGVVLTESTVWADGSTASYSYKSGSVATSRTVAVDGTRTTISYDSAGHPTSELIQSPSGETSTMTFVNGIKTSVVLNHADGTSEFQAYNLTGLSYTTQVQVVNAKGVVVSVTRSHADGSLDYTELHKADGSKVMTYYNATGHKLTQASKDATGNQTTLSYDLTGKLTKAFVQETDGDVTITTYTNGIKTSAVLTHANGTSEFQAYNLTGRSYTTQLQVVDAKGVVVSVTRSHADGSLDYTELHNTDGSKVLTYYDATGHKLTQASTDATGNRTTLSYDLTGKLTKAFVQETDGDTLTTIYSAGIKANMAVVQSDGSKSYTVYDTKGGTVSQSLTIAAGDVTNTAYLNGVKMSVNITHANGTSENYAYNLTGRTYTTQVQVVNAKGVVVSVTRSHADGSLDYTELHNTDGSKVLTYYDATGHKLTQASTDATGNRTTLSYDLTGKLTKAFVQETDGDTLTTIYSAGIKANMAVVQSDGSKSYTVYDTKGGTVSQSLTTAAGDVTNTAYLNGVKMSVNMTHANGSTESYAYGIVGKSYTTQYQSFDATGHLVSLVRSHPNGSLDSTEAYASDGSKVFAFYNSAGVQISNVAVAADGTRTTLSYDSTGHLTQAYVQQTNGGTQTTTYTNGVKTSMALLHADGSSDNYAYNIVGRTYTTQHQLVDAHGNILSIERDHADGTHDYMETDSADGSKVSAYYNSAGQQITNVAVATDGTRTTLSYDTTGHLTKAYVQETDGDTQTTAYTNGVKTSMVLLHADGSSDNYAYNLTGRTYTTQHQALNAKGNLVSIERDHADGTHDYTETDAADGTKVMSSFDATGHILSTTTIQASNARDVLTYLQDGTGDVRHDIYNSAKVLQTTDLTHKDGTHTATAFNDSQTLADSHGNDTFYLYANDEKVSFTGGHDTVYSFNTSAPTVDHVVVSTALAHSFSDLTLTQSGSDVLVSVDHDNSIVLAGTQLANVHSDMFLFG